MIENCQSSSYRIYLKSIAIVVLIAFVTTQFDLRLAFAYSPASAVPAPSEMAAAAKEGMKLESEELRKKLESTRFSAKELEKEKAPQPTSNAPLAAPKNVFKQPRQEKPPEFGRTDLNFVRGSPLSKLKEPDPRETDFLRSAVKSLADVVTDPETNRILSATARREDGALVKSDYRYYPDSVVIEQKPLGPNAEAIPVLYQKFSYKEGMQSAGLLGNIREAGVKGKDGSYQAREKYIGDNKVLAYNRNQEHVATYQIRSDGSRMPLVLYADDLKGGRVPVSFSYSDGNRVVKISSEIGGKRTDEAYRLSQRGEFEIIGSAVTDADGKKSITQLFRDVKSGRVEEERITDAEGQVTVKQYNRDGNLEDIELSNGVKWSYEYHANGSVRQITENIPGRPALNVWKLDESGQLPLEIQNDQGVWRYQPSGLLDSFENPDGTVEKYFYDGSNRLTYIKTTGPDGIEKSIDKIYENGIRRVSRNGVVQDFEDGRPVRITYPLGGITQEITYEGGRIASLTLKDKQGVLKTARYTVQGVEIANRREGITYLVGHDGRLRRMALQDGTRKIFTYGADGKLTHIVSSAGPTSIVREIDLIDTEGKVRSQVLAASGEVIQYNAEGQPLFIRKGPRLMQYAYTPSGKLSKIRIMEPVNGEIRTTLQKIGSNGEVRWIMQNGFLEKFGPDGRVTMIKDSSTGMIQRFSYTNGILTQLEEKGPQGDVTYQFDEAGRVTRLVTTGVSNPSEQDFNYDPVTGEVVSVEVKDAIEHARYFFKSGELTQRMDLDNGVREVFVDGQLAARYSKGKDELFDKKGNLGFNAH